MNQLPTTTIKLEPHTGCIAGAMAIVGNKWTALILRDLAAAPKRFSQLERSLEGISPRTLSQRLEDLAEHDIISRGDCPKAPTRSQYSLTDKGRDLLPIIKQMAVWGAKYYN